MIYVKQYAYISLFDVDPDYSHNLISCSLYHCLVVLRISSKSVDNIMSNIAINKHTNNAGKYITSPLCWQ